MSSTIKQNKYEIDMCNGTIMDKLISFSLPLMLSGILQLMFNAVDIIVVGRFSGSQALAAVGSTTALINVFTNLFIGISLGANVLAARFYAAGKDKEMSETVHTAITLALISGIIMAFVGLICAKPALALMDTPDDVIDLSSVYMRIYFLGMPFFMLYNYGAAILRAVGDTKRPLLFLVISGIANTGLNLCFVIIFKLGVAGVAIGTVISQLISCVLVLRCLYMSETSYQLRFSKLTIKGAYVKQIFSVGVPAGIQSTVINFSNVLLQSSVNSFGSVAMAGYTAANKLYGILESASVAFGYAMTAYMGQNRGARNAARIDAGIRAVLVLSAEFTVAIVTAMLLAGKPLLGLFLSTEEAGAADALAVAYQYLMVLMAFLFALFMLQAYRSSLQGLGEMTVPTISGFAEMLMRMGAALVLPTFIGQSGVFFAEGAAWVCAAALNLVWYYIRIGKIKRDMLK